MNILLIGGGQITYFLGRTLISKGHKLTVINNDKDECVWLSRHLKAIIVQGDGSDPVVLEEAGIESMDQVLAVTLHDEDNLVIGQLADLKYQVPRTLAIVNDPDLENVFKELGVTAISTSRILASIIEERASYEQVTNLIPISEGKVNLTEIRLTENSPVIGKPLLQITLPKESLICLIIRNDVPVIPRGHTVLCENDRLFIITLPENHGESIKSLTGE